MNSNPLPAVSRRISGLDPFTVLGLGVALVFFVLSGLIAYLNLETLRQDNERIVHSGNVIGVLDRVLSSAQDAETGQRGFLLTADEKYLQPYDAAVEQIRAQIGD